MRPMIEASVARFHGRRWLASQKSVPSSGSTVSEPSLEFRSVPIGDRRCYGMADVGRELKHCLDLLSGDPGKPFDELIDGGAVLEVFGECPHRHTGIGEQPHTADL